MGSRGPKMRQNHRKPSLTTLQSIPKHIQKLFYGLVFGPNPPKTAKSPNPLWRLLGTSTKTGHFELYFGNFSAERIQNAPKTWSIVVCTHTNHMLLSVRDFEPSRRRNEFWRGLACFTCNGYSVRRTLITRQDGMGPNSSPSFFFLPSSFFLLPSPFFLLPSSFFFLLPAYFFLLTSSCFLSFFDTVKSAPH